MKKNATGIFLPISILLVMLHTLRGHDLTFTVAGRLPYILYYATMGAYGLGLLRYGYHVVKMLCVKIGKNRQRS